MSENDRPSSLTDAIKQRISDFERVLREQVKDLDQAVRDGVKRVVPPDAAKHLAAGKREFLLAIRNIVDNELKKTDSERKEE